jgi:hypothetical protein
MANKNQSKGYDLKPILVGIGLILIPLTFYIFYRMRISHHRLIPISVIALLIGAVLENKRLSEKWKNVFYTVLASFILSFLAFIPGKHESFETHILIWPYCFLFFFVIISIGFYEKKLIPRLTEGVTLVLSIAIIYWVIDHGFYNSKSFFFKLFMIIGLLFSIFSIFNAFTDIKLTKNTRLILSIWSSIIMILLSIDNIYHVYQDKQVEDAVFLIDKFLIGINYFLLGICSVYIVQNFMMIIEFFPGHSEFFNAAYYKRIKKLKKEHIDRYSDNQVNIFLSLTCFTIIGAFFILNYYMKFLSRNIAIWIVFFVFNNILYLYDFLKIKTTANTRS